MATYKLMQDIEAEDHILGPLSLRQFIFALIAVFLYYICFLLVKSHVAFFLVLFVPPALFFTFFAMPFGRDQPTEVWALAKLRFLFKPRNRVWDQSGAKELVTITVPKRVEHVYTDGLSQVEVRSRLSALANTIDSRGWAVKNVNVNGFRQPDPFVVQSSDRLVDLNSMPQEVPNYEVQASDDILDEQSNPIAQQFEHMIIESAHQHRQELINAMNNPSAAVPVTATVEQPPVPVADYWFMNDTPDPMAAQAPIASPVAGQSTPQEEALMAQLKAQNQQYAQHGSYARMRTLQPLGARNDDTTGIIDASQSTDGSASMATSVTSSASPSPISNQTADPTVTAPSDAAILSLANNNDLNVATIAREAQKARDADEVSDQDEVVISLR